MKRPIALVALAVLTVLAFGPISVSAAERACRPSLSNWYHCPDTSKAAPKTRTTTAPDTSNPTPRTRTTTNSDRPCRPSLSNLWTCPDTVQPRQRTARATRPCRPSLSNGYHCPDGSAASGGPGKSTRTTSPPTREGQTGEHQYSTERQASARCPSDTVVWANTRSNIYHFRGTHNYGTTIAGTYICEQDAIAEGMRAAKNETHP
jgi:hypothetical protein